jgi:hypothetical protein
MVNYSISIQSKAYQPISQNSMKLRDTGPTTYVDSTVYLSDIVDDMLDNREDSTEASRRTGVSGG